MSLDSDETAILALKREAYDGRFTQACRLGDYVFSEEAFRLGNGILRRLTEDPAVRAVFLDEAGPLELSGRGFAESLPALARSEKDLFIAVRAGCLADFLRTYEIENPRIIPVSP